MKNKTFLEKNVLTPRNGVPFGDYSYYICLQGLKVGRLAGFMFFLCIICTILYIVYFGKFLMTFIDTGKIGCMSIPKCQWVVIFVNLHTQTWFFYAAACWCVLVYARSASGIPASSWDNRRYGSWRVCYKALQAFYRDFCSFIGQGLAEFNMILGWVVHTGDCMAEIIPNIFYGVTVWRLCSLHRHGDVAMLKKIKDYLGTMRCGVIVLVAVVIPKMRPGKWH